MTTLVATHIKENLGRHTKHISLKKHRPVSCLRALGVFLLFLFESSVLASEVSKVPMPSDLGPRDFDYELIDAFAKGGGRGLISSINADPALRGTPLQLSYFATEEQAISIRVLVGNYTDRPVRVSLICFVD